MESGLLAQGFELMLVGMGTVFVFLTALVGATSLMSSLVMRRSTQTTPIAPTDDDAAAVTAAIAVAIARHRERHTPGRRQT